MRILPSLVVLALFDSSSAAARSGPSSETRGRERLAIGVLATPALEGGGPWFLPAIRISAPIGAKHDVDLEAGRIFGGSSSYAEIRTFLAGQVRIARQSRGAGATARYWLAGFRYLGMRKLDGQGAFVRSDPDTALTIGHGWKQTLQNGLRAVNEVGFSAGRGFMAYATVGVQWGPWPRKPAGSDSRAASRSGSSGGFTRTQVRESRTRRAMTGS